MLGCGRRPEVPSYAPQRVKREVVRRFVAAATSSSDRISLRRTVGGGGETSSCRCGHEGTAAAAPFLPPAAPDGPPTDSEHAECTPSEAQWPPSLFNPHLSAHVYCGHGRPSQLLLSSSFLMLKISAKLKWHHPQWRYQV